MAGVGSRSTVANPTPIRIAFVIDRLQLPAGGTERQLVQLVRRMDPQRFSPTIFCLEPSQWLEENADSLNFRVVPIHLSRHPSTIVGIWRFARILREQGFDVVQTHFRDSNIVGVMAASLAGVDVIVSTRRGVPYWSSALGLGFLKLLNTRVTRFLANSEATRNRLVAKEGVEPGRVEVIHNGLDPSDFERIPEGEVAALKAALGLPASAPVVGIVANLRRVKGLDVFLVAASRVVSRRPDARFVIVGQGEDAPRLRELSRDLDVEDHVRFLGARDDVPELLHVFDIGVLSSEFESFANSILEYLAADLPVVVTDVGGAREAVHDGEDGFVVPPGDPDSMATRMLELLDTPGGPRAWRSSRGLPPRFHVAGIVKDHEDFYQRLVAAENQRPPDAL